MKIKFVFFVLGFIGFLGISSVFALEQDMPGKDEAVQSALKEEAMQEAFKEIEMDALLDDMERGEVDAGSGFTTGFASEHHTYLRSEIVYNDNVWHVADNVKSDLWLYLNPGIQFAFGNLLDLASSKFRQKVEMDLGAEIAHSFYRSVALNRESPYGKLAYSLEGGRNKFGLNSYFVKGYDLASSLVTDTQGLSGFEGNTTSAEWEYSFNRLGLGLAYERRARQYAKQYKASNTYEDSVAIITGFFKVTPKTRVFLEYDLGRYEYTKARTNVNDYDYDYLWFGANGQLTKKLFGLAKIGYENYKYDSGSNKDGLMTIKTDLEFRQSPRSTYFLNLSVGETSTGYVDLGIDKQYLVNFGLLRELSNRLSFKGDLSFIKDNYKAGQVDKTYAFGLSLNYLFQKWMKLKLSYQYSDRTSTSRSSECQYNRYSFGTEIAF